MATPHNSARIGEIAKTVLMPGDPLRAKIAAEKFLDDIKLVSDVRNVYAYTGVYKGSLVSIMASGMGMPSIGIYSYELYTQYGVENIVRIGSAGSYVEKLDLYDVVLVESAWSASNYARVQNGCRKHVLYPNRELNKKLELAARGLGVVLKKARTNSSDVFYSESNVDTYEDIYRKHKCECVEMESFALFHNANVLGKRAACLLTISDSFTSKKETTSEERQNKFTDMIRVALEAALTF